MQNSTLTLQRLSDMTQDNVEFDGQGVSQTLVAGQSAQNVDLVLADDCFVSGGQLIVKDATFGDTFDLQVVDVSGLIAPAGTVIKQFVTNYAVSDDSQVKFNKDLPNVKKIPAGLALRVSYNSTGSVAPQVGINWDLYKAKY